MNITIKEEDGVVRFIDNENPGTESIYGFTGEGALLHVIAMVYTKYASPEQISKLFDRFFAEHLLEAEFTDLKHQISVVKFKTELNKDGSIMIIDKQVAKEIIEDMGKSENDSGITLEEEKDG